MGWRFIHIPKTGGSALGEELGGRFTDDHRLRHGFRHATAAEVRGVDPETWDAAWTFGFVRDPFTRFASWATYRLGGRRVGTNSRTPWWRATEVAGGRPAWTMRSFLCGDDGAFLVSRTFRFEERASALREIAAKLGVELAGIVRRAGPVSKIPGELASMYSVPGAVDHVRTTYAADFELFGYSTEPPTRRMAV